MNRTTWLAWLGAAGATYLALTLGLMHVIQPELSPQDHFVSEYAHGSFGWLVMVGYVTAGIGCLSLAWAARSALRAGKLAALVAGCLVLVGIGLVGTGLTRIDLATGDRSAGTVSGQLHELVGYVAILGLVAGGFLVAAALRRDARTSGNGIAWAWACAIVLAVVLTILARGLEMVGIGQRIFLGVSLSWLVWLGLELARLGGQALIPDRATAQP
jgi:hypothetical protein